MSVFVSWCAMHIVLTKLNVNIVLFLRLMTYLFTVGLYKYILGVYRNYLLLEIFFLTILVWLRYQTAVIDTREML